MLFSSRLHYRAPICHSVLMALIYYGMRTLALATDLWCQLNIWETVLSIPQDVLSSRLNELCR